LPTDSRSTSSPSSPTILSPAAYFSNDHYAGTGSLSPDAFAFRSATAEQPSSAVDLPVFAA